MAAMAPALTDAPAEARHIHLKLAAASSGFSTNSTENNSSTANLLLSSSVSPSSVSTNGLDHLQPLVASYLCSDVVPVVKESHKVQNVLKNHVLLSGSLFHSGEGGDYLLRKALSGGGQVKGLIKAGGGAGSAMVPVNGLARKVAVPSPALPEKGCVATVNGDIAKHPASGEALLPLSSKSGDVLPACPAVRDMRHQRDSMDVFSQTPEDAGFLPGSLEVKLESDCLSSSVRSHFSKPAELTDTNWTCSDPPAPPQTRQDLHSSSTSISLDSVLQDRAQQTRRRHSDLSGRLQRLCKRLQVMQAKQVERHVRHQLSGFLDHALTRSHRSHLQADALGHFLKGGSVPSELEKLHLSGSTTLKVTEVQFDSDATESSSGDDSDVEEEELARVDIQQRHVKLWRRAEGRFALDRGSIISRWSWLQANISDLEHRIRQQADIYKHIRTSKGCVEFGDQTRTQTETLTSQNPTESFSQFSRSQTDTSVNFYRNITERSDCSAARVRPLISCKRRRLIQPNMIQNSKVQRVRCSRCDVNTSCVMCGGFLPKADMLYERPLVERLSPYDPSVHPTLSLQSDVCVSVQLQSLLKSHWQTRRVDKLKPLKKLSLKHKLSLFSSSSSSSSSSSLSKHKFRLSNSLMSAVRLSRHKSRSDKTRRQQAEGSMCVSKLNTHTSHTSHTPCRMQHLLNRSLSRKRSRDLSLDRTESSKLPVDAGSSSVSQSCVQTSSVFFSRQLSLPNDSSSHFTTSQTALCSMPIRKKRSENSYDINNIVIPKSVAAATRVEKLQYKEIITPSWRMVDLLSAPLADEDDSFEVEDVSDAAFAQLHQKCEDQERGRWRCVSLTPANRRGSRCYKSVDGRSTPSSPDTGHFLQDYCPVPSPLSPPSPDTPSSPNAHTPHPRDTTRPGSREDTRCSTPDLSYEERTVQSWDRRIFPLFKDPVAEPPSEPVLHLRFQPGLRTSRTASESEASSPEQQLSKPRPLTRDQ